MILAPPPLTTTRPHTILDEQLRPNPLQATDGAIGRAGMEFSQNFMAAGVVDIFHAKDPTSFATWEDALEGARLLSAATDAIVGVSVLWNDTRRPFLVGALEMPTVTTISDDIDWTTIGRTTLTASPKRDNGVDHIGVTNWIDGGAPPHNGGPERQLQSAFLNGEQVLVGRTW